MPDSFATIVDTHLDAAYQLARWLTRDASVAEDVVQDAMVRALTYFASFRGENPKAWLLTIVRNVALGKLGISKHDTQSLDDIDTLETQRDKLIDPRAGPEEALHQQQEQQVVSSCIERLPLELRECLILREWEELSYKEIATVIEAPIGTVMSRLFRARQLLANSLSHSLELAP